MADVIRPHVGDKQELAAILTNRARRLDWHTVLHGGDVHVLEESRSEYYRLAARIAFPHLIARFGS
ncbi:MAG: hypothetical protein LC114_25070 [Bryobacterales bacterium]|nr:hypothetical protein [Bryobacterales bacterium]